MIIDSNSKMVSYTDSPPAYEPIVPGMANNAQSSTAVDKQQPKVPEHQGATPPPLVTLHVAPIPVMPQPRVYYYQNSMTGEHLTSFLPPDHPEMLCLQQGGHDPESKFGLLGILAAIIWFPLGMGLCVLDRRVQCRRCGVIMNEGICG